MVIPGHQEVQDHQVTDCEFEHLMIFAGDWVNKGNPRRYVNVETKNFSFELFNMSHSVVLSIKELQAPQMKLLSLVFWHRLE